MDSFLQKLEDWLHPFFSTKTYDLPELMLFFLGFMLWVLAYYHILKDVRKFKYCEMPMIVAAGNIAWEFSWSFLFVSDLGPFFTWGCRLWFTMDIFINYSALKYGLKEVSNPFLRKHYLFWYIFSLLGWFCVVYFMRLDGMDDGLGVVSALLINVVMSSLYIYQILNYPGLRNKGFSYKAAWYKMFGTGSITFASCFIWPEDGFLISCGVMSFILDAIYIYLFKYYKNPELENMNRTEIAERRMPV